MKYQLFRMAAFCLFFAITTIVQSQERIVRKYNSQEYMDIVKQEYPLYYQNKIEIEQYSSEFCKFPKIDSASISFVFHVLYKNSSQKLSKEIIEGQIRALNENFNNSTYEENYPGDPDSSYKKYFSKNQEINFCLAPNGVINKYNSDKKGINYRNIPNNIRWDINNEMKNKQSFGADAIAPKYLINVWIVDLENDNAGFAQLPGGDERTDGIVIDYQFFGSHLNAHPDYSAGGTFTHLVANYLNVLDLWSDKKSCGDDLVMDTPIHNAPNNVCPETNHISTCSRDYFLEMTMNFMDNTPDACQFMFTHGQKKRMHYCLSELGPRYLLRENGCDQQIAQDNEVFASERETENEEFLIEIYPNPVSEILNIEISQFKNPIELNMLNSSGLMVYSTIVNENGIHKINFKDGLAPGVYLVKCTDKTTGKVITKRVIHN